MKSTYGPALTTFVVAFTLAVMSWQLCRVQRI
jgi:hypothetical protein